jgi:hypothetical protein
MDSLPETWVLGEGKTRPQEALKGGRSYSWLASNVGLALLEHFIFYNSCKVSLFTHDIFK